MTINWFHLDSITANVVVGVVIITVLFVEIRKRVLNPSGLPVFNDRKWFEFGYGKATARYIADPEGWIRNGLKNGEDAFYLCTESHFRLILSPKYADIIGGDNRFDLGEFLGKDFHAGIPGFEALGNIALESKIVQVIVKTKLSRQTRKLMIMDRLSTLAFDNILELKAKLVSPLSTEATLALETNWTEESEWHQVNLKHTMGQIVAQMVSRGFLGDGDLCRDPAWLNCIYDFLEDSFVAAHNLRRWATPLRLIASRFMPSCRKVRAELQEVIKYLEPLLDKENGPDSDMTALSWVKQASKGSAYDFTTLQVTLALASLDTSNDLLVKVLCDLSDNPTLVNDIRKEIIEVVGEEGLTKSSVQKLYLLDSAMKESQRLRPLGYSNMERLVKERVVLPDGLIIPRGTAIMVSACHMMDSSVWPDGDKYDGYRFAKLRKNAKNSLTSPFQFTSTSPNHMGFGHGKQACPGRHYAAVFGKILLCHVLLKYDFKVVLPEEGCIQLRGHNILAHSDIKINIRRRKAEISL